LFRERLWGGLSPLLVFWLVIRFWLCLQRS